MKQRRPRPTISVTISAVAAIIWLGGCDGQIGQPQGVGFERPGAPGASTGAGGGMSGTTGGAGGTSGMPPLDCTAPRAAAFHARLLSPTQYNNMVAELVKVGGDPSKDFGGASGQLDDLSVERRANAAADVAKKAAATLAQWSPCVPPQVAAATCELQIIDSVAPRAYRHPLFASERQELQTLFDAGVLEKDFATGVEWFLTGLLQSPDFSYQFARPAAGEKPGDMRPLAPYELASRLSFFLWDSMPDDALLSAAAAGNLGDGARVGSERVRMGADARFMRGVTGFYDAWLKLDGFHEVARDDAGFTTAVVNSLRTSLLMSATELYARRRPTWRASSREPRTTWTPHCEASMA